MKKKKINKIKNKKRKTKKYKIYNPPGILGKPFKPRTKIRKKVEKSEILEQL